MSSKNTSKKNDTELHASAVKLGKAGGKKGGPARAAALTDAQRSAIARKGGLAPKKKG